MKDYKMLIERAGKEVEEEDVNLALHKYGITGWHENKSSVC